MLPRMETKRVATVRSADCEQVRFRATHFPRWPMGTDGLWPSSSSGTKTLIERWNPPLRLYATGGHRQNPLDSRPRRGLFSRAARFRGATAERDTFRRSPPGRVRLGRRRETLSILKFVEKFAPIIVSVPLLLEGHSLPLPAEPDDTERFALQTCPHCSSITAVALCLATTTCEVCGERLEVAPLLA